MVIFDLDGTLIDSYPGIAACLVSALEERGFHPDNAVIRSMIGAPLDEIFRACGAPAADTPALIDGYRQRYLADGIRLAQPFAGVKTMLTTLNELQFGLAIATTKLESIATALIHEHQLTSHFLTVVGATQDGSRDHKRELINEVLSRLSRSSNDAVMVGDRAMDIAGAKASQVRSIGVEWGYAIDDELATAAPDEVAGSPAQLVEHVAQLFGLESGFGRTIGR